jgi:hypothetical protein
MDNKSFFNSLFDFSFSSFITPKIIKVLFVIGIVLSVIYAIAIIATAFAAHIALGIVVLILSPIVFILFVLAIRVYLEILIIMFRIQNDVAEIKEKK